MHLTPDVCMTKIVFLVWKQHRLLHYLIHQKMICVPASQWYKTRAVTSCVTMDETREMGSIINGGCCSFVEHSIKQTKKGKRRHSIITLHTQDTKKIPHRHKIIKKPSLIVNMQLSPYQAKYIREDVDTCDI